MTASGHIPSADAHVRDLRVLPGEAPPPRTLESDVRHAGLTPLLVLPWSFLVFTCTYAHIHATPT